MLQRILFSNYIKYNNKLNPNKSNIVKLELKSDYTYINNNNNKLITSFGMNLNKRLIKQQNITNEIIEKLNEIKSAIECNTNKKNLLELNKNELIKNKLKQKGLNLLK